MIAYITESDIRRWEQEGRFDIISHVRGTDIRWFGDIIVTNHGIHVQSCTFLNWNGEVFYCDIYETRPQVCSDYAPGSSALCPLYGGYK
jgi:Fe-S-cluster containining protein